MDSVHVEQLISTDSRENDAAHYTWTPEIGSKWVLILLKLQTRSGYISSKNGNKSPKYANVSAKSPSLGEI